MPESEVGNRFDGSLESPNAALLNGLTNELRAGRLAYEASLATQEAFTERAHRIEELIAGITRGDYRALPDNSRLFDVLSRGAADKMAELDMQTRGEVDTAKVDLIKAINNPREVLVEAAYQQDDPEEFLRKIQTLVSQDSSAEEKQKVLHEIDPIIQSVTNARQQQSRHHIEPVVALPGGKHITAVRIASEGQVVNHDKALGNDINPFDVPESDTVQPAA